MTTIYLPATKKRPATPAPLLLTQREVLRMLRLSSRKAPKMVIHRLHQKGLPVVKIAGECRYVLPDVVEWIRTMKPVDRVTEAAGEKAKQMLDRTPAR